jgi:phage terminase large subunit
MQILQHQADFITSQFTHTGLVGGFRSGKSHAGVIKTIIKKMQLPSADVAYYLPTYGLIRDVAIPKFTEILDLQKIPFKLNQTSKDIHIGKNRIILRSMDNSDLIIGYEVGYSCIDEADVLPLRKMREVMIKVLSRNSARILNNNNATDFVSTPEGFNFLYDFFVKNESENKFLIKAQTKNNPFISENYIKSLEEQYSPEELLAYLNGEFVNLKSGTVYNSFDRNINKTDIEIIPREQLHIGIDFNVTQMACVVLNRNKKVLAEYVNVFDTIQMVEILKRDFANHQILIYPDASGNSRKSAGQSDFDIIKKAGFRIISPNKNPSVKDRVNAVNKFFRTGGQINIKNCPNLTASLEQQTYKNGEPDKSTGHDHINDALGYVILGLEKLNNSIRILV